MKAEKLWKRLYTEMGWNAVDGSFEPSRMYWMIGAVAVTALVVYMLFKTVLNLAILSALK